VTRHFPPTHLFREKGCCRRSLPSPLNPLLHCTGFWSGPATLFDSFFSSTVFAPPLQGVFSPRKSPFATSLGRRFLPSLSGLLLRGFSLCGSFGAFSFLCMSMGAVSVFPLVYKAWLSPFSLLIQSSLFRLFPFRGAEATARRPSFFYPAAVSPGLFHATCSFPSFPMGPRAFKRRSLPGVMTPPPPPRTNLFSSLPQ